VAVRALIVDDSPFARRIIRHHLEKLGCKIVGEADNAAQGVAMFQQLQPELVTLDVMMPEVGGIDSLAAFRTMKQQCPDVAVVVVSVIPYDKTRETFLQEGALGYILKPFNQYSFEPIRLKLIRVFRELAA
jgi:two-component system, chemotaxis family, chemotaxis protein CheY